jgi:hypothetical protein
MLPCHQRLRCVCLLLVRSKLPWKTLTNRLCYRESAPPEVEPPSPLTFITPYASTKTAINTHSCRARRKRQRLT